jgi:ATP-dependent RNA helicase RhlE
MTEQSHKRDMLSHIIRESGWHQVLVFTRTKHGANRLAEKLVKDGLSAAAIHGNKSQAARTRALAGFKDGKVSVLVATDIAARGIDIDQLPHVVNFELPNVPEDYVHRIGRTGRAGSEGSALSLVDRSEVKLLSAIEKLIKRSIDRITIEGWSPDMVKPISAAEREREERFEREGNDQRNRRQGQGRPGGRNGGNSASRGARPQGEARTPGATRSRPAAAGSRHAAPRSGDATSAPRAPRGGSTTDRPRTDRPARNNASGTGQRAALLGK